VALRVSLILRYLKLYLNSNYPILQKGRTLFLQKATIPIVLLIIINCVRITLLVKTFFDILVIVCVEKSNFLSFVSYSAILHDKYDSLLSDIQFN